MCALIPIYICVNDSVLLPMITTNKYANTHRQRERTTHIRTTVSAVKPKNTLEKFDQNVRLRTHQLTQFTSQSVCRLQYTIWPSLSPFFSAFFHRSYNIMITLCIKRRHTCYLHTYKAFLVCDYIFFMMKFRFRFNSIEKKIFFAQILECGMDD